MMFAIRPYDRRNDRMSSYDPFRAMEEMERSFWNNSFFGNGGEIRTDIQDKGDSFLLEADLPGFNKDDIHVDLDADTLTIRAERRSEHEEKDKQGAYLRCERSYGSYTRSFDVSGIQADAIRAQYTDGVLRLTLPKKVETVPTARRLEIE